MSRVSILMVPRHHDRTQPHDPEELPAVVDRLLTAREVADALRVSPMTVYRMVDAGELRALRVGRQLRIAPADVAAYIAAHTTPRSEQAS